MKIRKKYLLGSYILFCSMSCSVSVDTGVSPAEIPTKEISEIISFADKQLRVAISEVELAQFKDGNKPTLVGVDHKTGNIVMGYKNDWRGGFFPASLWLMYELTGDNYWAEQAKKQTEMNHDAVSESSHDAGFKYGYSWNRAYLNTQDKYYFNVMKEAADTMLHRFVPTVGCIWCWPTGNDESITVIIDNMMNIELLFNMTRLTGDSAYYKVAKSHADVTLKNHFRENGSSYHVVEYDKRTGGAKSKYTAQGYSDESYWSRGQSWGLYGFTMAYRYTRDSQYLQQAQKIADFLLGLPYSDDFVPYWDMMSPDIPNTVRDASAATIMSSALVELSKYSDSYKGARYLEHAIKIVKNLHKMYESPIGEQHGFLLMHSTQNYRQNDKVDVPLVYTDYYYLETIKRLTKK